MSRFLLSLCPASARSIAAIIPAKPAALGDRSADELLVDDSSLVEALAAALAGPDDALVDGALALPLPSVSILALGENKWMSTSRSTTDGLHIILFFRNFGNHFQFTISSIKGNTHLVFRMCYLRHNVD